MKKYIILILLTAQSLFADDLIKDSINSTLFPRIFAGIYLPMNINFNSGRANDLGTNHYCCNGIGFNDADVSTGIDVSFGVIYGNLDSLPVLKTVSYGTNIAMSWFTNLATGESQEIPRKVYLSENTIGDLYETSSVAIKSNYLKVLLAFNLGSKIDTNSNKFKELKFQPKYSFNIGPIIGVELTNDADQYVEISNDQQFKYTDGSRKKLLASGSLSNSNSFLFGIGANISLIWNLKQFSDKIEFDNIEVSFGLGYDYYFSNTIQEQSTKFSQFNCRIGLNWFLSRGNNKFNKLII